MTRIRPPPMRRSWETVADALPTATRAAVRGRPRRRERGGAGGQQQRGRGYWPKRENPAGSRLRGSPLTNSTTDSVEKVLAPQAGLEPAAKWLTTTRSAVSAIRGRGNELFGGVVVATTARNERTGVPQEPEDPVAVWPG